MNGKHPIDDLFAHSLRDAEAQPPPAVWEGILRERERRTRSSAALWQPLGIAALILLLAGAGHWVVDQQSGASPARNEQPTIVPTGTPEGQAGRIAQGSDPALEEDVPAMVQNGDEQTGGNLSGEQQEAVAESETHSNGHVEHPSTVAGGADRGTQTAAHARTKSGRKDLAEPVTTNATDETANAAKPKNTPATASTGEPNNVLADPGGVSSSDQDAEPTAFNPAGRSPSATSTPPTVMEALNSRLVVNEAVPHGPNLWGDSTPTYVMQKGHWWVALQGEWTRLNGEWTGTGSVVPELNTSESWREGRGSSVVMGRAWWSGWSIGLGIGATKQRSRFLRREVLPGQTEMVVDTTWTATPMGQVTNYTWDIVETFVSEPGVERDYSTTNTYTRLRIAPEVGYRVLQNKRLSLDARFGPILQVDIGREGNTVVATSGMDTSDVATSTLVVSPLDAPSLDGRFPLGVGLTGGLDLRYRLCDRWSISVSPTMTYWIPGEETDVPLLSMNELGGALRLRYELPHQERQKR